MTKRNLSIDSLKGIDILIIEEKYLKFNEEK